MYEDMALLTRPSTRLPQGVERQTTTGVGRRSFLKRLSGSALLPLAGWLAGEGAANADSNGRSGLSRGDTAILRFLAAAEIIETDLWQQYNELALGNAPFQQALGALDGDMGTYVNQNTRNELSHQTFINAYLMSKG